MTLACPGCGAAGLPEPAGAAIACPACGSRYAVRFLEVGSVAVRKVAGVGRRRYQIHGPEGSGDPVTFEGPPDLPLGPGARPALLLRDGAAAAILLDGALHVLSASPSAEMEIATAPRGRRVLADVLWIAAAAMVFALAWYLDAGTVPWIEAP